MHLRKGKKIKYLFVGICILLAADLAYWKGHTRARVFVYDGRFLGNATGQVRITMCNVSGDWEVREIAFGLPISRPGAAAKIAQVSRREAAVLAGQPRPAPEL